MSKLTTIKEAIKKIHDGASVAIGGNVLHRSPMALVREIARQNKKNLTLIKTAGAMDVDVLCFAGCVREVHAGFISYESKYSLANHYRMAVQSGEVIAHEHACYTVISALRAAQAGVGFMPVKGMTISDLIDQNDYFTRITDPFSGETVTVVRALVPDYAIIHVQEADEKGNAYIDIPVFEDVLMAKATKHLIISAERIVPTSQLVRKSENVLIPHFLTDAVVCVEKGAAPGSCLPNYDINERGIEEFKALKEKAELEKWLSSYEAADERGGRFSQYGI